VDGVVNQKGQRMLETAGKNWVLELNGNKLALHVVGFFIPSHRQLQFLKGRASDGECGGEMAAQRVFLQTKRKKLTGVTQFARRRPAG
jgi:hypothetical protein